MHCCSNDASQPTDSRIIRDVNQMGCAEIIVVHFYPSAGIVEVCRSFEKLFFFFSEILGSELSAVDRVSVDSSFSTYFSLPKCFLSFLILNCNLNESVGIMKSQLWDGFASFIYFPSDLRSIGVRLELWPMCDFYEKLYSSSYRLSSVYCKFGYHFCTTRKFIFKITQWIHRHYIVRFQSEHIES